MIWRRAILFSETPDDWTWAEKRFVGLPAIIRVLVTLHRFGIEQVICPVEAQCLKNTIEKYAGKKDLPHLFFGHPNSSKENFPCAYALCIRGGLIFGSELLNWFYHEIKEFPQDKVCMKGKDNKPIMASFFLEKADIKQLGHVVFETFCSQKTHSVVTIPSQIFLESVAELTIPGNDRTLLAMVEKADEAGHVRWIRNRTFSAVKWFADVGISPNQITWTGFWIGILGAYFIAMGGYWGGLFGAALLCVSWISDNMDGTLARLTFSESPTGEKLDTALGHLINISFFIALVWAVYGRESLLIAAIFVVFMVGSIVWAHRVCQMERRLRTGVVEKYRYKKLQVFLDQINGRDFAVLIFLFALCDGFKWFLWGSLAGLQVFWMLHLWLLLKHRFK